MERKQKIPKEKRKNNEKRKEKSRNAARCRRSKESELYYDLASSLPISTDQVSQLDKASVMRLAISYLKIRNMIGSVPDLTEEDETSPTAGSLFLKTLDGFVMILSEEGDFIYLSENVNEYLGINQIDLLGQNVYDYSHPCDHDEIKEMLSGKETEDVSSCKSLFIRMKCTLTTNGRSVTLKSAVYKVIHSTGHIIKYKNSSNNENSDQSDMKTCYVAVSQPIPHPSNIECPLSKQTFLTKHNMDMKFTHADDDLMNEIIGYDSNDLLGKSVFEYYHAVDIDGILASYKCLFSKGQCQTGQYRFLAKSGGYVWLITQATLILDKNQKPQSVVCVNYIISGLECKDEIYSSSQYLVVKTENKSKPEAVIPEIIISDTKEPNNNEVKPKIEVKRPISSTRKLFGNLKEVEGSSRPISATSTIFAPRTEDMNKGFLTFSDEEPGLTMLKDEPEDLTHLAPVAGDVCVPLEDHPFLPDMLDDILLRDNFGPLLNDAPSDPFIAYRDFQDPSPQLLSPNLSKHSDCSLTSLNSPCDSLIDEDQSSFMNLQMDDVDLLKSPYTSMNISDDIPLLVSNDLMWSTNDKKSHQIINNNNSSLAQLLSSSLNKQMKSNDHGGGLLRKHELEDMHNMKNIRKSWQEQNNLSTKMTHLNKEDRGVQSSKRSNTNIYEYASKKTRNEPKEKISSELLHQLISNSHNKGRPNNKDNNKNNNNNWLLHSGKAACVSQPSDSVLMNLLIDTTNDKSSNASSSLQFRCRIQEDDNAKLRQIKEKHRRNQLLKNLLDPEAASISSLMDLTQQDYEVNAPVGNNLLQGIELLTALDTNSSI
ncbi:unnamed protein product [Psylliodes chrysocephalus]|uniref:Hypoxia-inducible factor 1-alpha n=1 Tax=Psylliodes chrysocephalus TaxID=3402493 RepID=A0A9P0CZX5_9CUCU|nr:unnamed protein product [Psylliodes chrysocephala]